MVWHRQHNSLNHMHTSFSSSMNVFLVIGLSKSVRASMSLATPPSVPEDSITLPDSSREILKSVWRKQFKSEYNSERPFCHVSEHDRCHKGFTTYKACINLQFSFSPTAQLAFYTEESYRALNSWMHASHVINTPCPKIPSDQHT